MREAIRAAIEALEKAEDFAGDVHHGEWAGPGDRRDKVIDKIESALSLLREAVGEGEEPSRYRWDTDLDLMVGPVPYGEWVKWADVASPIAADVQEKKNES